MWSQSPSFCATPLIRLHRHQFPSIVNYPFVASRSHSYIFNVQLQIFVSHHIHARTLIPSMECLLFSSISMLAFNNHVSFAFGIFLAHNFPTLVCHHVHVPSLCHPTPLSRSNLHREISNLTPDDAGRNVQAHQEATLVWGNLKVNQRVDQTGGTHTEEGWKYPFLWLLQETNRSRCAGYVSTDTYGGLPWYNGGLECLQ